MVRFFDKILSKVDNIYMFHDQFSHPRIVWGSDLFWALHEEYWNTAILDFIEKNKIDRNDHFIFIGHSHGSSLKVGEFIEKLTNKKPGIVYITPCFNPKDINSNRYKTLIITGSKDEDGCSIDPYNLRKIPRKI